MFSPESERHLQRLRQAMDDSGRRMEKASQNRFEAYRQYCGKHYGDNGTQDRVPLNMIEQACSIILRSLISAEPQAQIVPPTADMLPDAYSSELALNEVLRSMRFGRTMRTWIFEAMMSPFSVLKVAIDAADVSQLEGMEVWTGRPVAEPVLWEDLVIDMGCRRPGKWSFIGNRFLIPKEDAKASGLYDPELIEAIPTRREKDEYQTSQLASASFRYGDDYRDMIELWDVWLPEEGLVLTLSREMSQQLPLRILEWTGPPSGPFYYLWFNEIPGSPLPLPPVALWRDIHELANKLFNKLGRQAMRQKTILPVPNDALEEGKRTIKSQDGEAFPVGQSPDKLRELSMGGVHNGNFAFVMQLKQLHSYYAGNLDLLGGLSPQSGTLGQDQLLNESASERIKAMQEEVYAAASEPMRAIWWYLTTNPAESVPISKPIDGTRETLYSMWSPADLGRPADDFRIEIKPYSLQTLSPSQRLTFLHGYFTNVLSPLAPLMAQSGQQLNIEALNEITARLSNDPFVRQLILYTGPRNMPPEDQQAQTDTTVRRYERVSRPGRTDRGQEQVLINTLLGGMNQPSEQGRMMG